MLLGCSLCVRCSPIGCYRLLRSIALVCSCVEIPEKISQFEPSSWAGVLKGKELTKGPCGEGDPLPLRKELTEGPFGRRGSLTRTQKSKLIFGLNGTSGVREGLWKD